MVGRKSVIEKLKKFKEEINNDIPIQKMIFFGSRVRGKTGRDTDVDLVIVSTKFKKIGFFRRGVKLYDRWNLPYPVDFLCYTPEEFNKMKKRITIVREAVREGKEI